MSRSIARQCLAPGTTVPPGEVLVATEVGDPSGGLLACPAAPLVGGTLRRRGVRVSYAPVPRCGDASPSDDGATLFVTSALPPSLQPAPPSRNGRRSSEPAACWTR
jgi:hypothetical protein